VRVGTGSSVRVYAVVLAVLMSTASMVGADPGAKITLEPAKRISRSITNEARPSVDAIGTVDRFVVVWVDDRNQDTRERDVYGQLTDSAGRIIGQKLRFSNRGGRLDELAPDVAASTSAQQFLVVWEDYRRVNTRGVDVYGQIMSADGVRIGKNFRAGGGNGSHAMNPAVASNETQGEYVVVWDEMRNSHDFNIYGQRVSTTGARLGKPFKISVSDRDEYDPDVVWNSDRNEYLVVWRDNRDWVSRSADIWAQRLDANGGRVGSHFRVTSLGGTADEWRPAVAYNTVAKRYLVVWEDLRQTRSGIRGRLVSGAGALIGTDFLVSQAMTIDTFPSVSTSTSVGKFWTAWGSSDNTSRGRIVTASGARKAVKVITTSGGGPASAFGSTGGDLLTTWTDDAAFATRGFEIYGRIVTP